MCHSIALSAIAASLVSVTFVFAAAVVMIPFALIIVGVSRLVAVRCLVGITDVSIAIAGVAGSSSSPLSRSGSV